MGRSTTKPRINLVVDPEIYETVTEMAQMQGKSRAGLVMELIRSVHPALQRTLAVMKAAQQYQGEIPQELEQVIDSGLSAVQQSSRDQLHMLDELHQAMSDRPREPGNADASGRGRS